MKPITMPGLAAARDMERDAMLHLIDSVGLLDYGTGRQLAPQWRMGAKTLVCSCVDAAGVGVYICSTMAEKLLEGILICQTLLTPKTTVLLAKTPPEAACFKDFPVTQTLPGGDGVVCCSAEAFLNVARLFCREGAEKRLCRVSGGGKTVFLEIPQTCSIGEIAEKAGQSAPYARVGGRVIGREGFDAAPRLGQEPWIEFISAP